LVDFVSLTLGEGIEQVFVVIEQVFAVIEQVFAVIEQVFAVIEEVFAVIKQVFTSQPNESYTPLKLLFAGFMQLLTRSGSGFGVSVSGTSPCCVRTSLSVVTMSAALHTTWRS